VSRDIAKLRWLEGESMEAIAKDMGISRQAVSKWANNEGWHAEKNLLTRHDIVPRLSDKLKKITPEARQYIVNKISEGKTLNTVCGNLRISVSTLRNWRKADESLALDVFQAYASRDEGLQDCIHRHALKNPVWAEKELARSPIQSSYRQEHKDTVVEFKFSFERDPAE